MSDTPRTDRVIKNCSGWHHVPVEISKELERELNAANAQIGLLISASKQQERQIEFMKAHINRLEEAGDSVVRTVNRIQDWNETWIGEKMEQWDEAKESKP